MENYRQPRNHTEAVPALNIRQGQGQDRMIDWHYFNSRRNSGHYDINVKPGNTMHLTVWSGLPFLHVRSGHVTVVFRSTWGNSLTIHEGASAHIVVPNADTKVTVADEGGDYTLDVPEGKNRVHVYRSERAAWLHI